MDTYTNYGIIHFIAFLFAIYLAFKCNPQVDFVSVLAAICCPWIYILWILLSRGNFCGAI